MRLANEKSLELNITHEILSNLGAGAIGITQGAERATGGDILLPIGRPRIIQFKASKSGLDGSRCRFRINSNGYPTRGVPPNQHLALDAIGRSGWCDAWYAFPLIYTDSYFVSNMGRLLRHTVVIEATAITAAVSPRSPNWFGVPHSITVDNQNVFWVRSEVEGRGIGASGKDFLDKLKNEQVQTPNKTKLNHETIAQTIGKLESAVKQAGVIGRSEHTISFAAWNETLEKKIILSLPIQLHGLERKR